MASSKERKRPGFAIVRLDGNARPLKDFVSVKAVYDDQNEATLELARLSSQSIDSEYVLLPTRLFGSDSAPIAAQPSPKTPVSLPVDELIQHALHTLRGLHSFTRGTRNQGPVMAVAAQVATLIAARLIGASPAADPRWDLMADDRKLEVKAIITDPARRAPTLHFSSLDFDELIIVEFSPEFDPTAVYEIPGAYVRQQIRGDSRNPVLRVTPECLRLIGRRLQ